MYDLYARIVLCLLARALAILAASALSVATASGQPTAAKPTAGEHAPAVYLFWSPTCPHCAKAKAFLEVLAAAEPPIELHAFELGADERHDRAFVALNEHYRLAPAAVPLVGIGDKVFVGFGMDATTGAEIRSAVVACRQERCPDVVGSIIGNEAAAAVRQSATGGEMRRPPLPETIRLPGFGPIETRALSLPALTIVLGLVDGFNPCAMWVLVFLIGLLVGMRDSLRMWIYGAVFLLTSAVVYLAFMAAWLNVLLLLGSLAIIRAGIGIFAIGAGGYYLWQFWSNPDGSCPVTEPGERQRVTTRLKAAVAERSFLAAIAGIVVLAALVNLIELLCSAGIPAVYTQVLALSDLSGPAYAGYLMLYISVFLGDDVIVLVTALLTLRASGLTATYARYSHLLGAVILGGVGILLLLRPQWLTLA